MPSGRFNNAIFSGAKFGRLTVVQRVPGGKDPTKLGKRIRAKVLCTCDCGKEKVVVCFDLTSGRVKSCGCLNEEQRRLNGYNMGKRCSTKKYTLREGRDKVVSGAVFGRLTVVKRLEEGNKYTGRVLCQCSCGREATPFIDGLVSGGTRSCGCLARETTIARNKRDSRHKGFSGKYPRTWASWRSMLNRCYNKNQGSYKDYGAKGVIVCEYLRESPWNLKKLVGLRTKSNPSLDRYPIHDGDYTCGQCDECKRNGWSLNIRWTTRKEQSLNRGDFNVYLTAFGKTLTRSQWQDLSGINEWRIHERVVDLGWSVEKSLTVPDKKGNYLKVDRDGNVIV